MTQSSYMVMVVPVSQAEAMNRVLNVLFGDSGDNLSVPASSDGGSTTTHMYLGQPVPNALTLARIQALYASILSDDVSPAGGWPLMDGEIEILSKADALTAALSLYVNTNTGENAAALPLLNKATVFSALGLQDPND
jgi:hypothetical protein